MTAVRLVGVRQGLLERFRHPAQVIVGGFAVAVLAGTGLLALPAASESASRREC